MTVAFDTLKLARRLEAAGFPTKQAQDTAEALAETLTGNLATQDDVHALQAGVREVELRLRGEIREVEARLSAEIRDVETRLGAEIRENDLRLRADMAAMRAELIRWVVGVGVAAVLAIGGMILTAAIAILRALPRS